MKLLVWTRIDAGHYCCAEWSIRRSPTTRMWKVLRDGHYLGFRPTLAEAKGWAERVAGEGRRAA